VFTILALISSLSRISLSDIHPVGRILSTSHVLCAVNPTILLIHPKIEATSDLSAEANCLVEIQIACLRTILKLRYVANEEARKNREFDGWPSEAYDIGTVLIKTALILTAASTLCLA